MTEIQAGAIAANAARASLACPRRDTRKRQVNARIFMEWKLAGKYIALCSVFRAGLPDLSSRERAVSLISRLLAASNISRTSRTETKRKLRIMKSVSPHLNRLRNKIVVSEKMWFTASSMNALVRLRIVSISVTFLNATRHFRSEWMP